MSCLSLPVVARDSSFSPQLQANVKSSKQQSSSVATKFLHGEVAYSLEESLIDNLLDFASTPKVSTDNVLAGG